MTKKSIHDQARIAFQSLISGNFSLAEAKSTLLGLKDLGVTQSEAVTILDSLRSDVEDVDDKVLEVLDLATGWCLEQYRVWPVDEIATRHI